MMMAMRMTTTDGDDDGLGGGQVTGTVSPTFCMEVWATPKKESTMMTKRCITMMMTMMMMIMMMMMMMTTHDSNGPV
jgi:RsiW-degrading membrane proteinase PrsW (M82 family)